MSLKMHLAPSMKTLRKTFIHLAFRGPYKGNPLHLCLQGGQTETEVNRVKTKDLVFTSPLRTHAEEAFQLNC